MNIELLKTLSYYSGDAFLPEKLTNIRGIDLIGSNKKSFYVSGWSIVHFVNGILVGYIYLYFRQDINLYFYKMLILHTIWELWQMLIGMAKPYKLTGRSSLVDSIMDTIFFLAGTYVVRKIFFWWKGILNLY